MKNDKLPDEIYIGMILLDPKKEGPGVRDTSSFSSTLFKRSMCGDNPPYIRHETPSAWKGDLRVLGRSN